MVLRFFFTVAFLAFVAPEGSWNGLSLLICICENMMKLATLDFSLNEKFLSNAFSFEKEKDYLIEGW